MQRSIDYNRGARKDLEKKPTLGLVRGLNDLWLNPTSQLRCYTLMDGWMDGWVGESFDIRILLLTIASRAAFAREGGEREKKKEEKRKSH